MNAGVEAADPRSSVAQRGFSHWCWGVCVCVHVWVRVVWVPRYGVSRDYSGSLVCVESGQRRRLKILHDSPMLLGAFKKKNMNAGYSVSAGHGHLVLKCTIQEWRLQSWNTWQPRPMIWLNFLLAHSSGGTGMLVWNDGLQWLMA